ncbi:MAG: cytochrome P450 [Chlamydiae bacterium]|nr:cytochrome P450 [Chlamydiota bacterium]MBI3277950.1 cytochrome P450 [Chlamydiota bacterium]
MPIEKFPPGPSWRFPPLVLIQLLRNPIPFMMKMIHDYGDIAHFKLGPQHIFFINHPDMIQDVLVTHNKNFIKGQALNRTKPLLGEGLLTSEGELHLKQRRLIQPIFHRKNVDEYGAVMTEYADRIRGRWKDGEVLDISREMMRLTLLIVAKTLFNRDVEAGEAVKIGEALNTLVDAFKTMILPFSEFFEKLPLPGIRRLVKAREFLSSIIYEMIEERKGSQEKPWDLLSLLLAAQDMESGGERMSNKQVHDEAITLFLAGHETTSNALTWTWYLLSQHPEVEKKLHEEIDSVLKGKLPTMEDFPNLKYTEMVFKESMRLYPPAWAIGRRALSDYEIAGYKIPAKSIVGMSQYVMHRDPRYYSNPEKFDPGRWATEAQAHMPKFSYFPFGGGGRMCIGEHFAWMEGILLITTIAQKWKMILDPHQKIALQPAITLRPKYGMRMKLEKR